VLGQAPGSEFCRQARIAADHGGGRFVGRCHAEFGKINLVRSHARAESSAASLGER
jgi:hypothetical protein